MAKKKVNKTLVGSLTAIGFLVVTITGSLVVRSLKRSDPVHWVELAEAAAEEQDWTQAKFYYGRALQVSDDASYLIDMGRMEYEAGEEFLAGRYWNEAITRDPTLIAAHEKLIDLRIEIADMYRQPTAWLTLKSAAEALLAVDAQNPKALFTVGYAYLELYKLTQEKDGGSIRKGLENVRRAVQLAPEVVHYSIALATYLIDPLLNSTQSAEQRHEEVERMLLKMVADNTEPGEDAARVRFTYARFLGGTARHDEAVAMFAEAERFSGDDQQARARVKSQQAQYWTGRWYAAATNPQEADNVEPFFEKAKSLLEESIELDDEGFVQYLLLAELHAHRGDRLEAVSICERRINKPINRTGLKAGPRKYARYTILVKAADETLAHAASLERSSEEFDAMINKAEGFCTLALGEFPTRGPALHTMGKVKLARGNELEGIGLFQQAKSAFGVPSWRNSKTLAQLLLRHKQPGAAMDAIKDAMEDPQADPTCWGVAAQIALELDDTVSALRHADKLLRSRPGDHGALRVKMNALRKRGDTELADAIAERLGERSSDDLLQQVAALDTAGRTEQAVQQLTAFLEQSPDDLRVLRRAVTLLIAADQRDRAHPLVERALQTAPDNYEIKLLATLTDPQVTAELQRDAQLSILNGIEDVLTRNLQLAQWYGDQGMKPEYIAALIEAERHLLSPNGNVSEGAKRQYLRGIIERQFIYAVNEGSQQEVDRIVEKAISNNIDGAEGLTYRGRALMHVGKPEMAIGAFKQALLKQSTNARTLVYVGQCQMSLNPPQLFEAKTNFELAAAANPNLGIAHKGLAIVAKIGGDERAYDHHLAAAARLLPNDTWIKDQLLLKSEQTAPEAGIARREDIRRTEPDNTENLLALAELYLETSRVDKATECYDAILARDHVDTRAVVAASRFFRKTGNNDRALRVLEELVERTDGADRKANAVLLIADYWHKLGDATNADAALLRAAQFAENLEVSAATAKFKTDIGDYPAALEWHARAIELADASSPELAAYLRRSRIDVLFRNRDHDAAEARIDEFIARYPDDASGLLLKSAIDTVRGNIDPAIANIERYLEQQPGDLNATHQRARLYYTQGRYAAAIADLERLRSIDPAYKEYAARILLADGYALTNRVDLAYEELESIIREDPEAKKVAVHLIVLYREHEKPTDAIRVCTSMANRYPRDPVWLKNRADIKIKTGDTQSAIGDFEAAARLSAFRPHYTAALLRAYTEAGQLDKGIAYYAQTIPAERRSPMVIVRYADLLVRSGRAEEAVSQFLAAFDRGGFSDLGFVQNVVESVIHAFGDDAQRAIDLFSVTPDNPRLHRSAKHILAMVLNHYERDAEALESMRELLESSADDAEKIMLHATMGNVYERQRDWESAKTAYEELLRINERHLLGLNNLAFLLSDKLGRPREAIPYARQAAALYPIMSVRDTLAWTHVQLNEHSQAVAILTKILEEDPRYVPAIYHAAEAYRRNNELEKAQRLLEGASNLIDEGVGAHYRDKVRKAVQDVRRGETAP